jgi:TolB protein
MTSFALTLSHLSFAEDSPAEQLYIKLGEAKTKKSNLALPPVQFIGSQAGNRKIQKISSELYEVIANDLSVSTYFQMIKPEAYLEDPMKTSALPAPGDPKGFKFQNWQTIGTDFLIRLNYSMIGDQINLETYTYHVPKAQLIFVKKYSSRAKYLRKLAHSFTNELLKTLTGKEGMYNSRLVCSSDRAGGKAKEVFILDWDGANIEPITNHKSLSISAAWSPDSTKITYTAYTTRLKTKTRNADLFIYDFISNKRTLLSYKEGIDSGSNFAPDQKSIFMTVSDESNSDIFQIDLQGTLLKAITKGPRGAMNVEPAVSPDGTKIAFSSDRSGQAMIYIMDIDGSNAKRITFAGKYNSSPSWSPDGKTLAFAGYENSHFDIFTVSVDGGDLKRLTSAKRPNGNSADNENPSFSPDGRFIAFSSDRTGTKQLFIVTADGSEERRITYDSFNYFNPKWSNNIE